MTKPKHPHSLATQDSLVLALSHPAVTSSGDMLAPINQNESSEDELTRPLLGGGESESQADLQKPLDYAGKVHDEHAPTHVVPKDRYYLAQAIFFLLGVGMLFPWNVFITATSFFELKFFGSPYYDNFESWFSIAYNTANVLTLLFLMRIIERFTTSLRVYLSLVPSLLIFITITAMVKASIAPNTFFGIIMIFVILSGIAVGFLQNGIFSLSAKFPFVYTAATMSGQGLAGLAVAMSQILTTLAGTGAGESEDAIELSAILYFTVSVLVLALSIAGYVVLRKLPVFRYYHKTRRERERDKQEALLRQRAVDNSWRSQLATWRIIWMPSLSVCLNFTITLAIFPSIVATIAPVNEAQSPSRIFGDLFVPFAFLLFNIGDFAGRMLAGALPMPKKQLVGVFSFFRLIFFFLFLCSNVVLRDANGNIIETSLPTYFANDYLYWFIMLVFSTSNGYVASSCMIIGPNLVDGVEKEIAGSIMITSLVLGLSIGSFCSFGLRGILCQCNPFSS